jgi:hypothetical protein
MSKVFENTIIGVNCNVATLGVPAVRGEESYVQRVMNFPIALDVIKELKGIVKFVGVTQEFKDVIDYFKVPEGQTPAGFRIELSLEADGVLKFDSTRYFYDRT